MKSLIIGGGEIGKSLKKVLETKHEVYLKDIEDLELDGVEVLNICYPYSKDFVKITKDYIKKYKPHLVIIHSTVKPGTTEKIGEIAVHSPCHGKHPNLEGGIRTFVKYIGGENPEQLLLAEQYLEPCGIKIMVVANSKTSELSKVLCTTYYGWNILFMKEVIKICKKNKVPFHEVYTYWNEFYNQGYKNLNMQQFRRPVLNPVKGKIGGHCVVNNCSLLDSFITKTIKEKNEEY